MATVFGVMDKSDAEWATFWKIYTDVLNGFPLSVIKTAVTAYLGLETSEFFPKPGQIKAFCRKRAETENEAKLKKREHVRTPQSWSWPTDDELQGLPVSEQRREYMIMASQARGKRGAMRDDGTFPHPDWAVKAAAYEAEAQRLAKIVLGRA